MNEIRKYRSLKGITQSELSDSTQISRASIVFFESENCHSIADETLEKIASYLGETKFTLLGIENLKIKPSNANECKEFIDIVKQYADLKGFDLDD